MVRHLYSHPREINLFLRVNNPAYKRRKIIWVCNTKRDISFSFCLPQVIFPSRYPFFILTFPYDYSGFKWTKICTLSCLWSFWLKRTNILWEYFGVILNINIISTRLPLFTDFYQQSTTTTSFIFMHVIIKQQFGHIIIEQLWFITLNIGFCLFQFKLIIVIRCFQVPTCVLSQLVDHILMKSRIVVLIFIDILK